MQTARIAQLLRPFLDEDTALSDEILSSISIYLDILLRWNARINLTSIRDPEEIITRHFGESLFAAQKLIPDVSARIAVIDVGSGAGFPGIPLKLWARNVQLTLIESNNKKATFLREVIRALGLENCDVYAGRAESFSGTGDLVTLRAVERFLTVLPAAVGLSKRMGGIALLISSRQVGSTVETAPGINWSEPIPIPNSDQRILFIGAPNQNHYDSR